MVLYRSRGQSQDDFETIDDNFQIKLEILAQKNRFLTTAIGDFNAERKNWYKKVKTSFEGNALENITSQLRLQQFINEAMHIL